MNDITYQLAILRQADLRSIAHPHLHPTGTVDRIGSLRPRTGRVLIWLGQMIEGRKPTTQIEPSLRT